MTPWQRRIRFFVAVFAVVFAVVVFFAFRKRPSTASLPPVARLEPTAVVESTAGHVVRVKGTREDVAVDFEREVTYKNGSSTLVNVKVTVSNRGEGRTFTLIGKEGKVTDNPSTYEIRGDVRLTASDGLTVTAGQAAYSETSGVVQAPGPAQFAKGRMSGTGVGLVYDKNRDAMTILDKAVVHIAPDEHGAGAADVTCTTATYARRDKLITFSQNVKVIRGEQVIEAQDMVAHLSADEKRIDNVELHGGGRITEAHPAAGALQALSGQDVTLQYAANGESLQHAVVTGKAAIAVAGDTEDAGRRIAANTIDITLAPDGTTPTAVIGREHVEVLFPAEQGSGPRTIHANAMDAKGEADRGLTSARYTGAVEYREQGAAAPRIARASTLDVALQPGMGAIQEAQFSGAVRFEEADLAARSAQAHYLVDQGVVQLTGREGNAVPHVVNKQIAVDAVRIDLTLEGPKMKASGNVKSLLQPGSTEQGGTKLPAMLKQDEPVNVVGHDLDYDGTSSKAIYTGDAQLWQGDTSIRAARIALDDKSGDLAASGDTATVTTSVMLEQVNQETKKTERVRSIGTAKDFLYEDSLRRATYTGDAHLSGPEGDITAPKIELYLKESGNELERAEAYEAVTLRESGRTTTGTRMTYFADAERYEMSGAPVKIVDQCGGETLGRTLTFDKTSDTIVLDGKKQFRTQSKGGANKCPG